MIYYEFYFLYFKIIYYTSYNVELAAKLRKIFSIHSPTKLFFPYSLYH